MNGGRAADLTALDERGGAFDARISAVRGSDAPNASRHVEIRMPQLGESVEAGTIVRWLKAVGDLVALDEPLYEVSSDKANMEVPALTAGRLCEILAAEGAEVPIGAVVARIAGEPDGLSPAAATNLGDADRLSPVVRKLLREHGLDAAVVARSAPNARLTKDDVLAFIARRTPPAQSPALAAGAPAAPAADPPHAQAQRVPLTPLRRRIGERLSIGQKSSVNVFSVIEIDVEAVATERTRRKLTYLPFIARAVIDALGAHPALNATFAAADAALLLHPAVQLGIAVDLDERGLVVPVVRDAQRLTLAGIAAEIDRLATAARAAQLGPDEYANSTFTITNNGAFGTLLTAPVINPPNVAIVSIDAVELRPVIVDRAIAIRHRMYCCMTWDHRAFDGSTAGRFLARVKRNVETWDWAAQ